MNGLLDIKKSSVNGWNEIVAKEEDNEIGSSGLIEEAVEPISLELSGLKDSLDQTHSASKEFKINDDDGLVNAEYLDDSQIHLLKD